MKKPSEDPDAWFEKADKDLKVVQLSISEGSYLSDMACYHAQQCVEKYLKGFLISHRIEFPLTHLLNHLLKLCVQIDDHFRAITDPVLELQEYSTAVRYPPDEFGEPSFAAAQAALKHAQFVRRFVRQKIQVD